MIHRWKNCRLATALRCMLRTVVTTCFGFRSVAATRLAAAICLLALVSGCQRAPAPAEAPATPLAVANSYLESAALDLLGETGKVLRLSKPCFCPGHYDLETNMVAAVRAAALFLRFESEAGLEKQIQAKPSDPVRFVSLPVVAGTLTTAEYLALCRGVSAALVSAGQLDAGQAEARLSELASRLRSAAGKVRQQIADAKLRDTPVLAVAGQERFCEWLGFKVAGTFRLEDGNDPVKVEALVANARAAGVRFVVTDYSEIRPLADEVAKQLGLNSTRLASVPPLLDARPSYEEMLALNAAAFLPARRSGASR